jgi:hypothetical protein
MNLRGPLRLIGGAALALLLAPVSRSLAADEARFGDDLAFLRAHIEVVVLTGGRGQAQVAVVPAWQGRVATSTADGEGGRSFGWLNRPLIASGKTLPHMTPLGGEDRLWLGPEGGQFSLFFKPGEPFDLEHWQTPAALDSEPFEVVGRGPGEVSLAREIALPNRAGVTLSARLERKVRLLGAAAVRESCGRAPGAGLTWVAYESENRIINLGEAAWTRKTGLPSLWMLGMFKPSATTTVVIPLGPGAGRAVNDEYFGAVEGERLAVKGGVIFFRGDGQQRGKIGVAQARARPTLGSYDSGARVLTVVWYNKPRQGRPYVNSLWRQQADPFAGDVVNAYNDGPPAPGVKPLGPFYELETSSPGAELRPRAWLAHVHRTMHFQGEPAAIDAMARACLGVTVAAIEAAFR